MKIKGTQTHKELKRIKSHQVVDISQFKTIGEKTLEKCNKKFGTTSIKDLKTIPVNDLRSLFSNKQISMIIAFTPESKKKYLYGKGKSLKVTRTSHKVMPLNLQKAIIQKRLVKFNPELDAQAIEDMFDEMDPRAILDSNWKTVATEVLGYTPKGISPRSVRQMQKEAREKELSGAYDILNKAKDLHREIKKLSKSKDRCINYDLLEDFNKQINTLTENNADLRLALESKRETKEYNELKKEARRKDKLLQQNKELVKKLKKDVTQLVRESKKTTPIKKGTTKKTPKKTSKKGKTRKKSKK